MAFLTSQRGSGTPNVAFAFDRADQAARTVKRVALVVRNAAQGGTITAPDILDNLMPTLVGAKAVLTAAAAVQGIAAYAAEQYADVPGYAVGAEFTAMMGEIDMTITFFINNYPKDANNNLKCKSFAADGSFVPYASFTVGQRNAIVTRLDALIATID